jgi:hypothetical protein
LQVWKKIVFQFFLQPLASSNFFVFSISFFQYLFIYLFSHYVCFTIFI